MRNNKIIDEKKVQMIYKKIRKENLININNKEKIDSFDRKFKKAINIVKGSRVKRYKFYPSNRVVWIVEGQKSEYQIFPLANFCSCNDFYFHVVNNDIRFCYHLLAQKIAEFVDYYDNLDVTDNRY